MFIVLIYLICVVLCHSKYFKSSLGRHVTFSNILLRFIKDTCHLQDGHKRSCTSPPTRMQNVPLQRNHKCIKVSSRNYLTEIHDWNMHQYIIGVLEHSCEAQSEAMRDHSILTEYLTQHISVVGILLSQEGLKQKFLTNMWQEIGISYQRLK